MTPQQRRYFSHQRGALDAALKTARIAVQAHPGSNYLDLVLTCIDANTFERHQRIEAQVAAHRAGLQTSLGDYYD